MKHFTILLSDRKRQTRTWSVWSENLTVGADPRCDLVLPAPSAPLVGVFTDSATVDLPFGHMEIVEDTPWRHGLWASARERIAKSRMLGWREPGANARRTRGTAMALFGLFGLLGMTGLALIGSRPVPNSGNVDIAEFLVPLTPDKPEEPPKKEPEPEKEVAGASDQKPTSNDLGGSTETRTTPWPPNSPSSVMRSSVMDRISTATDGLMGEDVDANEKNAIDVILAGGGGHLQRGDRGGQGAGGDGDRMAGLGGIGLGTGGRAGFGTGPGGARQGRMALGPGGNGVGMRARVTPPRPQDVELGGEAGSRSPESILRVIRSQIGGFRYAYEKYLRDNPNLGGKISLKFTIAPSGDIVSIDIVSSNTGEVALDNEIKEKAKRMKFDQIEKGNVTVSYAFVLDKQ